MMVNRTEDLLADAEHLVDRLRNHAVLGKAPEWELAWLQAHGTLRRAKVGEFLVREGQDVEGVFAILSGRVAIHVEKACILWSRPV